MIHQESEETMEKALEESVGCLSAKDVHCNSKDSTDVIEELPEKKDEASANPNGPLESDNSFNRDTFVPLNQGYNRPFYNQECRAWPKFHPDFEKLRACHTFETHFYPMYRDPYIVENRNYMPLKMYSQGYPHEFQFQEIEYFVVIDFEATCDKDKNPHPQEIIEFPSVLVNSVTGQLEASFQTYVRPSYNQHLSEFCKELTGIEQIQVDRGVPLSEALLMHDRWLEEKGIKYKNFAVVTWTNWDCRVMLESECRFKRIRKPPYFNRWINLKMPFQEVFSVVHCNLKDAVKLAGLTWEGRPHCGLDDARNTARLLVVLMNRGYRFSITNSLVWHPLDRPPICPLPNRPVHPPHHSHRPKSPPWPAVQFHPLRDPIDRDRCPFCFCGVESSRCVIRKPGPMQGRCFFGCGNWTAARRANCNYFMWS